MNFIKKGTFLGTGAMIQGVSMATFLFPHLIPSGGAASISVLTNFILHTPFATTLWVLNAALLMAAWKWLGKENALWTMFCVTVTSVFVDIVSVHVTEPVSYVFIDLMIGAILFGIGIGILFRLGASSGGMDILALIISRLRGTTPGRTLFYINGSVLLLTGLIVDWKIILYAVICQFIATKIVDIMYNLQTPSRFMTIKNS
ncbi:YitT family protein [Rossellomorea aquimaris]|uniref:YitT family protein n=1 Tax=Rossellomorea aquimaris TaxID=189382 RepID=UPI0007D06023|nr:YitT family protein [Rossellomorea aquimaris]